MAMFFSGVTTCLAFFADTYWKLICYVVVYGFLDGSFIGLLSLVTLDIVGMKDFAQGYGIMLSAIGVPIALGPPVIGELYGSLKYFSYFSILYISQAVNLIRLFLLNI